MLVPAEIILDTILEDRADIPLNAIHMHSGLKADLYPVREGDELRRSAFQRRQQVDYDPPIGKVCIYSPEDLFACPISKSGIMVLLTYSEINIRPNKGSFRAHCSPHGSPKSMTSRL